MTPASRLDYVISQLQQRTVPAYMEHMNMPQVAVDNIRYKNGTKGNPEKMWMYEERLKSGFIGCKFPNYHDDDVLTQEDVIRLWGLTRWFIDQTQPSS